MTELGWHEGRRYGVENGIISWLVPDVREAVRAGPGRKLVIADYSQIEVRLMAFMSEELNFIEAINAGKDIHAHMVSEVHSIDYALMDLVVLKKDKKHPRYNELSDLRSGIKTVTFGVPYGAGPPTIAEMIRWKDKDGNFLESEDDALERATRLIESYFIKAWRLKLWLDKQTVQAQTLGYTSTIEGRRRTYELPDRRHPDYRRLMSQIGRWAGNQPIQGCVIGDTRIFEQSKGYVRISSQVDQQVSVWDGHQFANAWVVASGDKELMRMTLRDGTVFETSPDHQFKVATPKAIRWMKLSELESVFNSGLSKSALKNYRIQMSEPIPDWDCPLDIPTPVKGGVHNAKRASLQTLSNNRLDMGVWLGRLASDGSVSYKYNYSKSPLNIRATPRKMTSSGVAVLLVAEHEKSILDELVRITSVMGVPTVDHRDRSADGKEPMHNIVMPWTALAKQLTAIGIKGHIPEFVWSSIDLLRGYLRGMFDGDGGVNSDNVSLTFGGGDLFLPWAREIQMALRLFGIRSTVKYWKGKDKKAPLGCTRVTVLKHDAALFSRKVRFINVTKQRKLDAIRHSIHKGQVVYGQANSIRSIERTGVLVPMYDVVDSDTGQFAANGYVAHNSSADMLKDALRRLRRYLRGGANIGPKIIDANLLLVNHDEIVMDAAEEDAEQCQFFVEEAMSDSYNAVEIIGRMGEDGRPYNLYLRDIKMGPNNRVEANTVDYWAKD